MIFRHVVYDTQFSFVTIYKVGRCMMPSVLKICSDSKSCEVYSNLQVKTSWYVPLPSQCVHLIDSSDCKTVNVTWVVTRVSMATQNKTWQLSKWLIYDNYNVWRKNTSQHFDLGAVIQPIRQWRYSLLLYTKHQDRKAYATVPSQTELCLIASYGGNLKHFWNTISDYFVLLSLISLMPFNVF